MFYYRLFSACMGLLVCFLAGSEIGSMGVAYSSPIKSDLLATQTPSISSHYIQEALHQAAMKAGVPSSLLTAVCRVESGLNPSSYSFNDGGETNHAFGLCQVLRKTAEFYMGRSYEKCNRDFRTLSSVQPQGTLPRTHAHCELFGPKTNTYIAAMVLKAQIDRYNGDVVKGTAAYNSGSLKYCTKTGWANTAGGKKLYRCTPGDILNREYLNRVHKALGPTQSLYTFTWIDSSISVYRS